VVEQGGLAGSLQASRQLGGDQPVGATPPAGNQHAAADGPPPESFDEYDELFS